MRKAKTMIAFSLALLMMFGLAACGGGETPAAQTTSAASAAPATTQAAAPSAAAATPEAPSKPDFGPAFTEAPYWAEAKTFTMWASMDKAAGAVADWSENLIYKTMAEITNVTVEFLHPPVGSETESFNLMCASGDYPDAIQYGWNGVSGGPANYINDGVIIGLNDLMAANTPNINAYFDARKDVRREAMLDDGTFYCLPAVYGDIELATSQGPVIRADMLDKIGMTEDTLPVTVQDWEDMLMKVKATPEMKDIIPFLFAKIDEFTGCPLFLGASGIGQEWYNDNGTVKFGALQPEYKTFLEMMRRWNENGLLDPEFAANTGKLRDEKVTGDRVFSFIGSMGNSITRYTAMNRPTNPDFKLIPINYPTFEAGQLCPIGQQAHFFIGGVALTTQCADPEMICQFFDYFYSDQGHVFSNWGIEGETYEYDASGNLKFTDLIINNPDGLSREQAMAKYTIWQSNSPVYKLKDVLEQRDSLPEQIERRKNWMACENKIKMPPVTPTSEEASEFATIMTDCNNYYREQATAIIMGTVDLDSGFDTMVSTLQGMGIERATELRQAALDRYLARP